MLFCLIGAVSALALLAPIEDRFLAESKSTASRAARS
jgi:hypothetical protein